MIPEQRLAIKSIQFLLPRPLILPAIRSTTPLCVPKPLYTISKSIPNTGIVSRVNTTPFMEESIFEDLFALLKKATLSVSPKTEDKVITLYNIKKETYTTAINENTKASDITNEQMIEEVKKRALVKTDDERTQVNMRLKDDSMFRLGASKFGLKLTVLGQAYMEQLTAKNRNNEKLVPPPIFDKDNKTKFIIIIPPKSSQDTLIETGKQKHLLAVVDSDGKYYAIGYFTSKDSGIVISDTQVKIFQDQMENKAIKSNLKKQYFMFFNVPMQIKEEDINEIKWDTQYIDILSTKVTDYLKARWKNLCEQSYGIMFDFQGITKEICLEMCKEHDKIASKGTKHPISADQHRLNEENKHKQKAKNHFKNINDRNESSTNEKTN